MRKYQVRFWRAAALVRESPTLIENAAINILNLALQARDGQSQRNAVGVGVTTLVGVTLLEQTLTLSTESPALLPGECQ
jgi:hypothetical protein